jgi:hypothetical protein
MQLNISKVVVKPFFILQHSRTPQQKQLSLARS